MTIFLKLTCFRYFTRNFSMSPKITSDVLSKLRNAMKNPNYVSQSLHAYLVPSGDAHQNEYVGSCDERRAFVSGFTGSAGTAIVSEKQAALWTDGRYFLQAEKQMDANWTLMREGVNETPTFSQFLEKILPVDGRVGVDPHLMSFTSFESLATELELKGHTLLPVEKNLVDVVWEDRPQRPLNKVESIPIEYTGKSWQDKVSDIRKEMCKENVAAVVITALDEIAWLFNLRGSDIEFNPVFFAYSIIMRDAAFLFIDNPERLIPEAEASLERENRANLKICCYGGVAKAIETVLQQRDAKIWINGSSSYSLVKLVPEKQRVLKATPISLSKALKNKQEIECARRAHVKDAVALCEFFCWLSQEAKEGNVTEISAADKLEDFRKSLDHYAGLSFETISGSGPNGAIIHYKPTKDTNRKITAEEIYLCDSGAQYRDGGTTDVTRTMHFGTPSSFEKMCYTLVLKGHIALSSAVFPQHIAGNRLDSFARQPLWEQGLDYMHGTGHGVGAYLNVHEGPIGINYRNNLLAGLQEGMILSIEPGVYLDGKFGIRLENLAVLKKTETPNNFRNTGYLTFEPITLVPFQTKLIDPTLLNEKEVKWLNHYHSTCREVVGKVLNEQGKLDALEWLLQETQPLG